MVRGLFLFLLLAVVQVVAQPRYDLLLKGGHIVDPTQYAYKHLRKGVRLYPLGPEFKG